MADDPEDGFTAASSALQAQATRNIKSEMIGESEKRLPAQEKAAVAEISL